MTAMDELRRMLDERGVKHYDGVECTYWGDTVLARRDGSCPIYRFNATEVADGVSVHLLRVSPEQAIEATLGPREQPPTMPEKPPYDVLIDLLRDEWDIEVMWDGLRRFWYVGLTDEGVRKRDEREAALGRGMLTADDVRDLIERHSDASGGNGRDFHNGAYVAIADELNATLGRGTCHNLWDVELTGRLRFQCSKCEAVSLEITPRYCPVCGRQVVDDASVE